MLIKSHQIALIISITVLEALNAGLVWAEPPSAGWNFGSDTYAQHSGSLILNSLSDRYGLSTYDSATQHLGTNDYIPENAVKNQLALSGYTKAYDFNPNSQTGYGYSSVYNQPLPNVPLTKLSFMGLDGDPSKQQDVYVLTSEYNKLSDQAQAGSISNLNNSLNTVETDLNNESNARVAGDVQLQNQVNATNARVNGVEGRVNNLERLKVIPEASIRVYDAKHLSMVAYDAYDATNGRNFAIGMRVQLKLGRSYEERRIDAQDKEIQDLKMLVSRLERVIDK